MTAQLVSPQAPGGSSVRMLLDTDLSLGVPGSEVDDGFALALALAEPACRLELVTTVSGNTDAARAAALTTALLRRLGRHDIPVVEGAGSPIGDGPPEGAERAARALLDRIDAAPGRLTVVAIGPLTNLATALTIDPTASERIARIVAMGGQFFGQTHEHRQPGEFNFFFDPVAANIVLDSGAPVRLVGLDVTERARLTSERAASLARGSGRFANAGDYALAWIDRLRRENPGREISSCAMHDPLAVAVALDPTLCAFAPANVHVLAVDPAGRGVSLADLGTSQGAPPPNCEIATDIDTDRFLDRFHDRLVGW